MITITPDFIIETEELGEFILQRLERYGRTCYKSECRIGPDTARTFVKTLIDRQHESVLEHESVTVRIVCDRGVSHELVRHRIASYSQESTRYCDYGKEGNISFIEPPGLEEEERRVWVDAMLSCEEAYNKLRKFGVSPQIARSVLPNSLKTEIVVTMNLRSWRNFFKLRTHRSAHPQMREIAIPLLRTFQSCIPIVFEDITPYEA